MGYICIALRNLDPNDQGGPGSKWTPFWKSAPAENPQVYKKCGCVEHQYQLTLISHSFLKSVVRKDFRGPHGAAGRETPVPIQG